MDTNGPELLFRELAYKIVGAAMEVHRTLGPGFLEKVYHNALINALIVALEERGIRCEKKCPLEVRFHGQVVGDYEVDILVEGKVILELKTVEALTDIHRAQTINYLRATGLRLALLINFAGPRLEWERIVL